MKFALITVSLLVLATSAPARADWVEQHSIFGDGNDLIGVSGGSAMNAVAAGSISDGMGGTKAGVFYTMDGGSTWNATQLPSAGALDLSFMLFLSMPDSKTVYGGGLGFFKSANGGQSWAKVAVPGVSSFTLITGIQALSSAKVRLVFESKLGKSDNGMTWEVVDTAADCDLLDLHFINPDQGWVVGGRAETNDQVNPPTTTVLPNGCILKTSDAGATWQTLTFGTSENYTKVAFSDAMNGLLLGYDAAQKQFIRRTTDGGVTWQESTFPPHPSGKEIWALGDLEVINAQAWVVGAAGGKDAGLGNAPVVLHSSDAGKTWEHQMTQASGGSLSGVGFAGAHWGWAVGSGGKIYGYTDGTQWTDPTSDGGAFPGEDVTIEPDPVGWALYIGTLDDEGRTHGFHGTSTPDKDVSEGADSASQVTDGGTTNPGCRTEETTASCSASSNPNVAVLFPILFLLLLSGLSRLRGWKNSPVPVLLALLLPLGCSETTSTTVCEDTTPQSMDQMPGMPIPNDGYSISPETWTCSLTSEEEAPTIGITGERLRGPGGVIAFVRTTAEGGSDLWLLDPDSGDTMQLTQFNDPMVQVHSPSFSPSREQVAFISNYRSGFNAEAWNVFVVKPGSGKCWQVSPDTASVRVSKTQFDATLTGTYQFSISGIAKPAANASVGHPGAGEPVLTDGAGRFSIQVPSGSGTLVLQINQDGQLFRNTITYSVAAGSTMEVGNITAEEWLAVPDLSNPVWSSDSKALLVFSQRPQSEGFLKLSLSSSPWVPWLQKLPDATWVAPFPTGYQAVAGGPEMNGGLVVADLGSGNVLMEGNQGFMAMDVPIAISPTRFLAGVTESSIELIGSTVEGTLAHSTAVSTPLEGLIPGQLDWSPDGERLVATQKTLAGTDLLLLDLENDQVIPLTEDHRSSQPTWFGR